VRDAVIRRHRGRSSSLGKNTGHLDRYEKPKRKHENCQSFLVPLKQEEVLEAWKIIVSRKYVRLDNAEKRKLKEIARKRVSATRAISIDSKKLIATKCSAATDKIRAEQTAALKVTGVSAGSRRNCDSKSQALLVDNDQ